MKKESAFADTVCASAGHIRDGFVDNFEEDEAEGARNEAANAVSL